MAMILRAASTLAELMHLPGHSKAAAAVIDQHATADGDAAIAEALSGFYSAQVVAAAPPENSD